MMFYTRNVIMWGNISKLTQYNIFIRLYKKKSHHSDYDNEIISTQQNRWRWNGPAVVFASNHPELLVTPGAMSDDMVRHPQSHPRVPLFYLLPAQVRRCGACYAGRRRLTAVVGRLATDHNTHTSSVHRPQNSNI